MSGLFSPHSSDKSSTSFVSSPPPLSSSTFQASDAPALHLFRQSSSTALRNSIVIALRALSCAEGVTATSAPTTSQKAARDLTLKLFAASPSHAAPTHVPSIPRVVSSPLSPKSSPIVDRIKDLATSPCASDHSAGADSDHPTSPRIVPSPESSDGEEEDDAEDGLESSFSMARPTHVEIDVDTEPKLPTPPESAAHAAYRARAGSDIALYQAAFFNAHCAAADANVTGSSPPDLQIVVDTLPLPDLIRVHSYILKALWSLRHLIALVHRECSAGAYNTRRLMQVFADEASLDHHCARRIRENAANAPPRATNDNPVSLAIADPRLGPLALQLLTELVPYDYDPTSPLLAQIAALNFTATPAGLQFDGLEPLLKLTVEVSRLPHATLLALDMRTCYKALAQKLVALRQHSFICRFRGAELCWITDVGKILADLRDNGPNMIGYKNFECLVNTLDDYHAASIDFSNTYDEQSPPTPSIVAAIATTPAPVPTPAPVTARDEVSALRSQIADFEAYMRVSSSLPNALPTSRSPRPTHIAAYSTHPTPSHASKPNHAREHRSAPPRPQFAPTTRGPIRPHPAQTDPRHAATSLTAPRRDFSSPKLKCLSPTCPIWFKSWWLTCHCGHKNPNLSACLLCAGNPLSIDVCSSCSVSFTHTTSRPASDTLDSAQLAILSDAARHGETRRILPTRLRTTQHGHSQPLALAPQSHASSPAHVNALSLNPQQHADLEDARDFFLEYEETPWRRVNALHSLRQPSPARSIPTADGATLLLLPASTLAGDAFLLSGPQLFSLGWSATLSTKTHATLTDPSGNSYNLLPLVDGFPALTLQRIDDASGTYFSLGLPPGSGVATTALFDSCANTSIIPLPYKPTLLDSTAGGPLILGASVTVATLGDGLLPIRCFPHPPTVNPAVTTMNTLPAPSQADTSPVLAAPLPQAPPLPPAPTPTPAPPAPLLPTTATINTPCSSYTILVSAEFGPDVCGTTTVFAAYEDMSSSPMFFRQHSLSSTSILACVDAIITRLQRLCLRGCQLRQIRIDPSHLDFEDPIARAFSAARGITFVAYTQPYETSHYPSFLRPLFAKANIYSPSDNRALEYCLAGYAALFDPSYATAADGRLDDAAHALLSLGADLYTSGASFSDPRAPHLVLSRFQFTTGYPPDISYAYETYVPSGPAHTILLMYTNKLALTRDPESRSRPHPFTTIPTPKTTLPGEHWTLSFSTSGVPDDDGLLGTIFSHDYASSYLEIQSALDRSPDSLIICIDRLFACKNIDGLPTTDLNIKTITLDKSWFTNGTLTLSSPLLISHAAKKGYTLLRRPDLYPSITPGLSDIADAARSEADLSALYLITAAFELREHYAAGASYDFLRQARDRYNSNPFPSIHGPMSRHHIFHGEPITPASSYETRDDLRFPDPSTPWPQISRLLAHFPHLARLSRTLPGPF